MYSQHFGLEQDPFSIAPDPRFLFMSERHREALAHLLYGVSARDIRASGTGGGFVVLTGDIGTGKTTICRCFLQQIPASCHVAYIFNPKLTVPELLQTVCEEFHISLGTSASTPPTVKDRVDALNAFLLQSHAQGQSCVLIIDEAQNLQTDVLEQLRLLTNLETSERKLLQIVLIGQPELRSMLARPELEQLAQRVIARFHLDALSEPETALYIRHRLAVAGQTGALPFDRQALRLIHRLARGVPRRINLLCGRALLGAWATGQERVNRAVVKRAAQEVFGSTAAPATAGWWPVVAPFALAGLGLVVAAVGLGFSWPPIASGGSSPKPVAGVAVAPVVAAPKALQMPATALVASAAVAAIEPLDALITQLPRDLQTAWSALAPSWQLPALEGKSCETAAAQQWECYQTSSLTIPQLRQLSRPGFVTLSLEDGAAAYAVVVGLTDETATLQLPGGLHTVRLSAVVRLWQGQFATYWRAPQGYMPPAGSASTPFFFENLSRQLALLDGTELASPTSPPSPMAQGLDAGLRKRLQDFQRAHGLKPDGQPGPLTLMQLEQAMKSVAAQQPTRQP
jgi:general secretion pathway protein A